ncbi:Hypothetical predicted protein [Mytilus galloprovincialis]|uniref:Ig-like domain-containing protein n=1 Tax=Mytilus galloprovincialis TaxID=29158 RepID=A0A8B6E5A9_MYTGA|nr:Hypothetical predicted protein [Mytilus galloprovincialis]
MELICVFIIFLVDLSSIMLATGHTDPPTDVRIDIIDNTAIISWMIPSNQAVMWSRIQLNDSKDDNVFLDSRKPYKDIPFPYSSFEIANLKMCSEYYVGVKFIGQDGNSEYTIQTFWMTNTTFTAEIHESVTLSWRTSLTELFSVIAPMGVIYMVEFDSNIISNTGGTKFKFDVKTLDVSTINITVSTVTKADAGLYRSSQNYYRDMNNNGCCVLVVTTTPENPVLTIDHKHPFVNDNITFTCTATVQRWPRYIPSNISYQFFGITRGYINNNKLILNKLTKSDKDIAISCQATDDLGKVSNMSESIILDPYYGPDNVLVKPDYTVINVTEGTVLGPIHCTADCNPKCIFNWKFRRTKNLALVNSYQNLTVVDIQKNQAGIYRCSVIHPYDKKIRSKTDIVVNVQYSSQIRELWLSDKIENNEWSNAKIYSFNEVVNLKIKLSIESNPDPQLVLSTSLITFPPLRYTKKGIDFLSELPSLRCEDSGNYTIQAFNGINYGDTRSVNLMIYCKPRNVILDLKKIGTKLNRTEDIVMQIVSFPKPTVEWTRTTGFIWMVQKDKYDYRYRIYSAINIESEDDFGEYGIRVCNRFGCIVENITVSFEDGIGAVTKEYIGMFAAGITTLVVGLIVLIPGTIFVIRKCILGLRTTKKISVESDEYIEVHRSNPAVSEPYSILQPQSGMIHNEYCIHDIKD